MSDHEPEPSRIDTAIAEYLQLLDIGRPPDRAAFLKRYEDVRDELAEFLDNEIAARQQIGQPPSLLNDLDRTVEYVSSEITPHNAASLRPHANHISGKQLPRQCGPYRLIQLLGEGGMGQVYEALDESAHPVAIKFLNAEWAKSPESVERFKQEGALAGTINHPRCVFVRSVGEHAGQLYIVMELMSGKTLRDLVAQSGPMSPREAIGNILDVIEGLEEAHRRGVIHRDIKPANCFLEPSGRVKLGDFGLARSVQSESELTQTGSFIGTPLFASPEQIRGDQLDFRTDIYSLCATLYYLLTGKAPFAQYSATQVIARIVSEDPVPIRQLNPALPKLLEQIVARGLVRDRDRRYQTLDELREALEPFMHGRQAVAQLTRRIAAQGFDACVLSVIVFAIAGVSDNRYEVFSLADLPQIAAWHSIFWLYYLVSEAIWAATPGKLALQLTVVDAQTGERASFGKVLGRVTVYMLLGTEVGTVIALCFESYDASYHSLVTTAATTACSMLLLLPMAFGHGVRLLHDLCSGTLVVVRHGAPKRIQIVPTAPLAMPGINSAKGWPEQLGNFHISGVIWQTDHSALLVADDRALGRQVWLVLDKRESSAGFDWRKQVNRTSRLRWLDSGQYGEWRWNAFMAPSGAPLRYWVSPHKKFTWIEARSILEQIVDEFQFAREHSQPFNALSLDQLWLDKQGRVLISDVALDAYAHSAGEPLALEENRLSLRETRFALEAVRMCLTAKSQPLAETPSTIESPLPIHARSLLGELVHSCNSNDGTQSITVLKEKLRDFSTRQATITTTIRLWMLGVSAFTLLAIAGAMTSLGRIGNQIQLLLMADAWIEVTALQQIATDDQLKEYCRSHAGSLAEKLAVDTTQTLLDESKSELGRGIQERWQFAGSLLRAVLEGLVNPAMLDPSKQPQFEIHPDQTSAIRIKRNSPYLTNRQALALPFDVLSRRLENLRSSAPLIEVRKQRIIFFVANLPLLGLILWCTVLRGGLPFLFMGVHIAREDGRPAGWLRLAARSVLTWLPMIALCSAVVAIDLYAPSIGWLASVLHASMLGWLLLSAALTLRYPQRSPQDWLLGTYLVPR